MTATLLAEKKGVKNYSDLYRLKKEDLLSLPGFKDKKADNLLSAIEKSKKVPLNAFIFAIGIDGIGKVAAKDLASYCQSVEKLFSLTAEELLSLENIGEITAENIIKFFAERRKRERNTRSSLAGRRTVRRKIKSPREYLRAKT